MNYEVVQVAARQIIGNGTRVTNQAADCQQKIGALWENFLRTRRETGVYYGVYTAYQWEDSSYLAVVAQRGLCVRLMG